MYYLYIDESGDDGRFVKQQGVTKGGSSRFFTLAGIIVHKDNISTFDTALRTIISNFFPKIGFDNNLRLHYFELRQRRPPFDGLSKDVVYDIASGVFNIIKSVDCKLLSVTLDIDRHYRQYFIPVDPRAYALYCILERFQYFLEDYNGIGQAVYERYNSIWRKKVGMVHRYFLANTNFPTPITFNRIINNAYILNGDPLAHPVLQVADFFAYAVWKRSETFGAKTCRWNEIKHKYYNLNHTDYFRRGNIEI